MWTRVWTSLRLSPFASKRTRVSSSSICAGSSGAFSEASGDLGTCSADGEAGSWPGAGKALKAQDLRSDVVQKKSDAELTVVITNGKGKMPAFGKKLKPDDIAKLVAFIRALPKNK